MATTVSTLQIKQQADHVADYCRTYANYLISLGVAQPDVSQGTEIYGRALSLGQQVFAASSSIPALANAQMPDSALGDDLIRQAGIVGLSLRGAGSSAGAVVLAASITTPIGFATGQQLLDSNSNLYSVSVGGSYSAGQPIPITSSNTGVATNLAAGVVLRWTQPPPFVNPTAAVAIGGLTGGVNAETIEGLRARLLQHLQTPPNGANWPSITLAGNQSSPSVQYTFPYPACNGPSTEHVAVVRAPTATNQNRDVNAVTLSTVIAPAILAQMPEYVETVITTVVNSPTDVAFGMSLPPSTTASPAGPGGGWIDANPWPTNASSFAPVTSVTSSTSFSVTADSAPVVGQTICWVSTDDWVLRTGIILTSPSGASPWAVTIGTPFVSASAAPVTIAINDWVFPGASNIATYFAAALAGFAGTGPGEKTNNVSLLPRAYRRPLATGSWPSSLLNSFLRVLENAGQEVALATYLYRSQTTPALPATINLAPNILTPRRLGFYPI